MIYHKKLISGDVLSATSCSGSTLSLDCSSSSKSIKILHAMYGILPFSSKCGNVVSSKPCMASGTLQKLTAMCEHYKACKVQVSNPHFSLSCEDGQLPYLKVYYQCSGNLIKSKYSYNTKITPLK